MYGGVDISDQVLVKALKETAKQSTELDLKLVITALTKRAAANFYPAI